MSRRIDVELTSSRADGTWTWRAAGAKQPKGELNGSLLYDGAQVGQVVRADADFNIEGIEIIAVLPPKGARVEPQLLEIIGPPRKDEPSVTTVLAGKGRRSAKDFMGDERPRREGRGDRPGGRDGGRGAPGGGRDARGRGDRPGGDRPGGDRPGGDRPHTDRPRGERPGGDRPAGGAGDRRERRPHSPRPAPEAKPKARRLKAGRAHRNALLAALPATHQPIADQLLRGGIPGVRQAVDRQNELLKADSKPIIDPDPLMDIAERLMPAIRGAEWRDKAEAALAEADDVDIRDLRSVVVAADDAARDEESRALAAQLRDAVTARVDREHAAWLAEIAENLKEGRLVRALRLSSRPPKAGAPFPSELAHRLSDATAASLTADVTAERYATVLDALAFSPVRQQVTPAHIPAEPGPELVSALKKLGSRIPQIASAFGIEAKAPGRPPRSAGRPALPVPPPPPPPVAPPAPAADGPTVDALDPQATEVVPETAAPVDAPTPAEATPAEAAPVEPATGSLAAPAVERKVATPSEIDVHEAATAVEVPAE